MRSLLLFVCTLCLSFSVRAEDAEIAQLFERAGVQGTMVIESSATGRRLVHDEARAMKPYTAASTFKVFHTLIGLEEGAISGSDSVFRWDGVRREIEDWNRDQTLESAFKVSCVWCYQQLAQRVGASKYPAYIRRAGYGRLYEPFNETEFWLDGFLVISAHEQIHFLQQVVKRGLPFKASSFDTLYRIMLVEEGAQYRLYAKTGWAARAVPQVGWYVGFVETSADTWLFALNLDTRNASDLPVRISLANEALRAKGILPAN